MPGLNPLVGRSMYEYFFGMYGNDERASQGMNEIKNYFNTNPGAQDTYSNATSAIKALLTSQAQNGLPELKTMQNLVGQRLERTTQKNVRTAKEMLDPTLLKTMGQTAFNDIYANEEEAQASNAMNFTRLQLSAKENAINQLLGIAGGEVQALNQDRNYELNLGQMAEGARQYNSQADLADDFDWGSAIGGLLGGAGSLLGNIFGGSSTNSDNIPKTGV